MTRLDRAIGALTGLAIGDALGMPTQMFSRAHVLEKWGAITGFEPGPPDSPIAAGMPAGSITDDTHQAIILGRLLVEGRGTVDPHRFAEELALWERRMESAGSLDLLGPSTRAAIQALLDGADPGESGKWGATNGAAMRVAPVGIAYPARPLERLVRAVAEVDRVTHDTTIANAGACAVAAAVSAGIAGADVAASVDAGVAAARLGGRMGNFVAGANVADRIEWVRDLMARPPADPLDVIDRLVGTSMATQESVPAAFAILALHPDDPWAACCAAASLGGDSDTIAAMAGAIAGACHGIGAFPSAAVGLLTAANPGMGLDVLADALLSLRGES
jgi:ADP-ribosylglycohydrolase